LSQRCICYPTAEKLSGGEKRRSLPRLCLANILSCPAFRWTPLASESGGALVVHGHVTGCVNVIRDGTLPRDENEMTCNFAVVKVSGRCGRAVPVCVCVVKNRRRKKLGLFCYGTGSLQAAT
jgi:hypothetical protein